jgi:hypothetical protein
MVQSNTETTAQDLVVVGHGVVAVGLDEDTRQRTAIRLTKK